MRKLFMVSVMLLASIPAAHATISAASSKSAEKEFLNVSSPFEQQREKILTDLADGETYAEISQKDRAEVRDALTRISDSLQKAGGVDAMSDADKAKVFNDQELVNAILTRAGDDSRLVCTREKKVGSHRTTTQCMTVAERTRQREQSQQAVRDNARTICTSCGN